MNLIIPMNLDELMSTFEDRPIWVILKTIKDKELETKFNEFTKNINVNLDDIDGFGFALIHELLPDEYFPSVLKNTIEFVEKHSPKSNN